MNVRLLTAALLLCAGTALHAQATDKAHASHAASATASAKTDAKADGEATAKAQTSKLVTELGLDTKQAAEVEHLLTSTEKRAAALRADGDKGKPSLEKLSNDTFTKLKSLVNEEQGKKLDALKAAGKWDVACASGSGKGCCAGGGHAASGAKSGCQDAHKAKAADAVQ